LRNQIIIAPSFELTENLNFNFLYKFNDRISLEEYWTLDLNLEFSFKDIDLYLRANNIFDKIYRETNLVEMPGRWIRVGANVRLF